MVKEWKREGKGEGRRVRKERDWQGVQRWMGRKGGTGIGKKKMRILRRNEERDWRKREGERRSEQ